MNEELKEQAKAIHEAVETALERAGHFLSANPALHASQIKLLPSRAYLSRAGRYIANCKVQFTINI